MKYKIFLSVSFFIAWLWAAIGPVHPEDWLLENYLVFVFVPIIFFAGRYFKLSNLSYTLIAIFMILHVIGSHYTYAEVPFGDTLQAWLGADRNMYDRLVHFCYGFLLAYPVREMFMRVAHAKGFWSYFLPIDLTLSMSALYEVLEWLTALKVDPVAGLAFLGSQGDIWDAQKDMLLAGIGALITMTVVFMINASLKKGFWSEMKASFRISKNDHPLGEEELARMLHK